MNSRQSCLHKRDSPRIVQETVSKAFGHWGVFVAHRPCLTILMSIALAILLTAFVLLMETNDDTVDSWAPDNSITFANYKEYQSTWALYEDEIYSNMLIVSLKDNPSGNVLNEETLILLLKLYDAINEIEVEHDGSIYTYQHICARYKNGNCKTVSILDLFHYDLDTITSTYNNSQITYPTAYSPYSFEDIYVPLVLGQDIQTEVIDTAYVTTTASSFQMFFYIDITMNGDALCYKWYEEFLSVAEQYGSQSDELEVYYQGYNSFNDELNQSIAADQNIVAVGFLGLFILSTVMVTRFKRMSDGTCIECDSSKSRARIGWIGFVSSMMAVSSCWGLVGGICGVKFKSIVAVSPYLLVGIGR